MPPSSEAPSQELSIGNIPTRLKLLPLPHGLKSPPAFIPEKLSTSVNSTSKFLTTLLRSSTVESMVVITVSLGEILILLCIFMEDLPLALDMLLGIQVNPTPLQDSITDTGHPSILNQMRLEHLSTLLMILLPSILPFPTPTSLLVRITGIHARHQTL